MQVFHDLIAGIGNILGIDGFEPDAEGVCILESEEAEILIIDCTDAAGEVLLTAALMPLPAYPGPAAIAALKANHGFAATKGATVSVDPDTCVIELSRHLPAALLTPESLIAAVEEFSSALVSLRPAIESGEPLPPAAGGAQAAAYGPESTVDVYGVSISLRESDDGEYLFASTELIDLPAKAARKPVLRDTLAANHMFEGTAGAAFSLDPETERVCLQQIFWTREGGGDDDIVARRVAIFADKAREWKERFEKGEAEPIPESGSLGLNPWFMQV